MKRLYLFTLGFFLSGFINIHLSLLGFLCMTIPLALLLVKEDKLWCKSYCPRFGFFNKVKKVSGTRRRPAPRFLSKGDLKWMLLAYFLMSLFFILGSTIRVALGQMDPMLMLRFFIILPIPADLPQLLSFPEVAPWLTHLAYRIYSMMLTTTVLGLIITLLYRPRTWCLVCPIGTISDEYLKKLEQLKTQNEKQGA